MDGLAILKAHIRTQEAMLMDSAHDQRLMNYELADMRLSVSSGLRKVTRYIILVNSCSVMNNQKLQISRPPTKP